MGRTKIAGFHRKLYKTLQAMANKTAAFQRKINGMSVVEGGLLTGRAIGTLLVRETMGRGKEFTDRLIASQARAPSGEHAFDQLCTELDIERRRTPPKSPWTNGMVASHGFQENRIRATERCTGRIADVLKPTASAMPWTWSRP